MALEINKNGIRTWLNSERERHRLDGPAMELSNGDKSWHLNGKLHREEGPAVEWNDGTKCWYKNGLRHREDGPAIEDSTGYKEWWLEGISYTKDKYNKLIQTYIDTNLP